MPVLCQVRMINETPLIPDLERLEEMISEETSVAARARAQITGQQLQRRERSDRSGFGAQRPGPEAQRLKACRQRRIALTVRKSALRADQQRLPAGVLAAR